MKTIIKRSPEATFFVSGIVLSAISFWAQARWLHIANDWLGLGVGYDTRPLWFVIVMNVVAWLPWVAAALVIALRVTTGKQFKAVAFTLGVLSPLAMTIGFIFLQLPIHSLLNQKTFDSSAWIAQERKDPKWPARLTMVDDLVKRKLLDGKSKEEILAMLGPGGSSERSRERDLHYWLGPERGFVRIDSEWLAIRFNMEGRVEKYAIARD